MKKTLLLTLAILFCYFVNAGVNPTSKGSAAIPIGQLINLAGKNRYFSQKIAKAYLLKASGHAGPEVNKELETGVMLFEENVKLLTENAPNVKVSDEVRKINNLWVLYKNTATKPSSAEGVAQIMSGNTQILEACQSVVLSLVEYSETQKRVSTTVSNREIANCINLSGRLRMLSQRVSVYHIGIYESFTNDTKALNEALNDINTSISLLVSASANTSEVDDNLTEVLLVWKEIRDNPKLISDKKIGPLEISEWSNRLFNVADKLTKSYEKLL